MPPILQALVIMGGFTLLLAIAMTALPRIGLGVITAPLTRAPGLDLAVALLTWIPWIPAGVLWGWLGVVGAILGQAMALMIWAALHEFANWNHPGRRVIVKFINRLVGRPRNHAALWVTSVVFPVFWAIRAAQYFLYPMLVLLLRFPNYKQSEWVNVSRQKFDGLVGHDLIWCLYCDWMTGVYALGAEMLRNVESFWCPIRFYDGKKCKNCVVDFPDIDGGWVDAAGSMTDVDAVLHEQYTPDGTRAWFGHPVRLTHEGEEPDQSQRP